MFQLAVEALDASPDMIYIVSDTAELDIKDAFGSGLSTILYSPMT